MVSLTRTTIAALLLLPSLSPALQSRFELGRRLRAFEAEWDRVTDATARKRTLPHLKSATTAFFSGMVLGRLEEAGRGLDLARLALTTEKPDPDVLWAESRVVKPEKRLVDGAEVKITLAPYYTPKPMNPKEVRWVISLHRPDGSKVAELPPTMMNEVTLPLKDVKEGDYVLRGELRRDDKVLSRSEQTLSVARDVAARIAKIEKALKEKEERTTEILTARNLVEVVRQLFAGETLETNYPAARLLTEAEVLLANKDYFNKDRPGTFWVNVAVGRRNVPVRLQIPAQAKDGKPLPLVIAMHGAGGSENMFFDGYGNGAVAKLCAERGWLLVTTRNGLTDGLIDELEKRFPVDRKKVFLVGHSMGAGQSVAAVSRDPEKYAGVAALGGGGRIRASDGLKKVCFYIGIGKEDFALSGARSLKNSLERAGVEKVVFRELDHIEHLVIVQQCLPEVFRTFDESVKR